MKIWLSISGLTALAVVLLPDPAHAGMPNVMLSDMANIRLQNISFFLAVLLLMAFIVHRLWNFYRRDFPNLPKLNYKKALGLVVLWGLAFHLVLGMITGTRELLTPKAWQREGVTYKLKGQILQDKDGNEIVLAQLRQQRMENLRNALWAYAQSHQGNFPPNEQVAEIPKDTWKVLSASELNYQYVQGLKADQGNIPVAYEPGIYGEHRYTLLSNGKIERMHIDRVLHTINGKRKK